MKRMALEPGVYHDDAIAKGLWLRYRRPESGLAGSWYVRWADPETKKLSQEFLGLADDINVQVLGAAPGPPTLSHEDAEKRARSHVKDALTAKAPVVPIVVKPSWTVNVAMDEYLLWLKQEGRAGLTNTIRNIDAHIRPVLGTYEVEDLTQEQLGVWRATLAETARRRPGATVKARPESKRPRKNAAHRVVGEVVYLADPKTEDEKKKRKETANRIYGILRAGLNKSRELRKLTILTPWRDVKPYQGVDGVRDRFLSPVERGKLIAAATGDFKAMVETALLTGARYMELNRLKIKDFNAEAKTLRIQPEPGKTKGGRIIRLGPEAVQWFIAWTKSKDGSARMIPRTDVVRGSRAEALEPGAWANSDQDYLMEKAYIAAGIPKVRFHELRHTYASELVSAGMPLKLVAANIGHSTTRMVEKHYGHLAPDAVADAVAKFQPRMLAAAKPDPKRQTAITISEYQLWRQPGVPLPSNLRLVKG